jgi:TctA family transporter
MGAEVRPPEYCSLMLMGLVASAVLAHGDAVKGWRWSRSACCSASSAPTSTPAGALHVRRAELSDGIGFTVIAVGLFAVAEIGDQPRVARAARGLHREDPQLMPSRTTWRLGLADGARHRARLAVRRAAGHRAGAVLVRRLHAGEEARAEPERFGHGAIEGVAAPEAANNAAAQTRFIPTLTLGIPGSAVMALMVGAMMMHGIAARAAGDREKPGAVLGHRRQHVDRQPDAGGAEPAAGRALGAAAAGAVPLAVPSIVMFCCIGNYSVSNNPVDVYLCAALGVLGYVLAKLECEPAPLLLGYVLGPLFEEHLRRAMLLARGDPSPFFTRPISLAFMLGTALVLLAMVRPMVRRQESAE